MSKQKLSDLQKTVALIKKKFPNNNFVLMMTDEEKENVLMHLSLNNVLPSEMRAYVKVTTSLTNRITDNVIETCAAMIEKIKSEANKEC